MKKILLLPIFVVFMSFSQCDKDNFDKKPPINFSKMYYQDWVGGQPGSKGTIITLIGRKPEKEIVFDSIYFNKKVAKIDLRSDGDKLTLTANFVEKNPRDSDLILSSNPKEEFGNTPPQKKPSMFPFDLAENEAIISYRVQGKKRYYNIKKIKKEKTLYYP